MFLQPDLAGALTLLSVFVFTDQEHSLESLQLITSDSLKEVFPKAGPRLLFIEKLSLSKNGLVSTYVIQSIGPFKLNVT